MLQLSALIQFYSCDYMFCISTFQHATITSLSILNAFQVFRPLSQILFMN